ncbi:nuclear transport factor 2 family protein [Aggregatibacter kilianii]|uniref:nuclear transport factor 2 family protein n=1 Tax=Aggregatibacter kilianii TaxID=2025884 RepID=UPI000D648304|nr:nuclear transport factor 2 family protein [Aggregatibacter kilianii]
MKKILTALFTATLALPTLANNVQDVRPAYHEAISLQEISDRIQLKELVDTFSNLADEKRIDEQVLLFTENASVQSVQNGKANPPLVGRDTLNKAFSGYLAQFHTVYHLNGQQTVRFQSPTQAAGVSYCDVTLIKTENGKDIAERRGVRYDDVYVKQNGRWLIESRKSNFLFSQVSEKAAE